MGGKTKKAGITGRFGTRYGATMRKRVRAIEEVQKQTKHKCPRCESRKVKRVFVGVWQCKFCGYTFAGGAWIPQTAMGRTARRTATRLASSR